MPSMFSYKHSRCLVVVCATSVLLSEASRRGYNHLIDKRASNLAASLSNSSRLGNKPLCCCKMSNAPKHTEQVELTCKWFAEHELPPQSRWRSRRCPNSQDPMTWHKARGYFGDTESCHVGPVTVGPSATSCKGDTSSCSCGSTIDAVTLSNGRLKGRVLLGGSAPYVAGFFSVRYGAFQSRWAPASPLPPSQSKPLNDYQAPGEHCEKESWHRLSFDTSSAFCYQWAPGIGYYGSDDCFTLDIYTPSVAKLQKRHGGRNDRPFRLHENRRLPVMVYLYGGGYVIGDKYQNGLYDGRNLARKQKVVVITLNYRLGVLGFLHHPALRDAQGNLLANLGLQDQVLALRWIHEHIHVFGGDKDQITLFGESAGAMSICAHLASASSRRLIKNVILQSGNCDGFFVWQPQAHALDHGARYLRAVFGRIVGCEMKKQYWIKEREEDYENRQNNCDEKDTASLTHVAEICGDLFLKDSDQALSDVQNLEMVLPFEHVRGCDADYSGCENSLPSGSDLDTALLECAKRLETKYVVMNSFGLVSRARAGDASYVRKYLGLDMTGLPLPPHLWWSPVVDPSATTSLDFMTSGGVMPLPLNAFMDPNFKFDVGVSVTAGFNRDEGSMFTYVIPSYFPNVDFSPGAFSRESLTIIVRAVVCAKWVSSRTISGPLCTARVEQVLSEYEDEDRPSLERGKCCSQNPNLLRLQRLMSDHLFTCPTLRFLSSMSTQSEASTRLFEFRADGFLPTVPVNLQSMLGASHLMETFFVFGSESNPGGNLPLGGSLFGVGLSWSSKDKVIAQKISNAWGALARHEDPKEWSKLSADAASLNGSAQIFTPETSSGLSSKEVSSLRAAHHCEVLDELQEHLLKDVMPRATVVDDLESD